MLPFFYQNGAADAQTEDLLNSLIDINEDVTDCYNLSTNQHCPTLFFFKHNILDHILKVNKKKKKN